MNHRNLLRLTKVLLLSFLFFSLHAQPTQHIKFSEILIQIYSSKSDTVIIKDNLIENDLDHESAGAFLKRKYGNSTLLKNDIVHIDKLVAFRGNSLPEQFGFDDVAITRLSILSNEMENTNITFVNFKSDRLNVQGPPNSNINMHSSDITLFETKSSSLSISQSNFSQVSIGKNDAEISRVDIFNCNFKKFNPYNQNCIPASDSLTIGYKKENSALRVSGKIQKLIVNNNNFEETDSTRTINILCSAENMYFSRNNFGSQLIAFYYSTTQRFHFSQNTNIGNISFIHFLFDKEISQIDWPQIANKICTYYDLQIGFKESNNLCTNEKFYYSIYRPKNLNDFSNTEKYDQLVQSYQGVLSLYKTQGNIESYNAGIVELKDFQTLRSGYQFYTDPNFNRFFRWQLNRLMKVYTEHGTDPAKSITMSLYVVMLFGIIYFFFPSDWDVTSKSKLIGNFKDFVEKNDKGYIRPLLSLLAGFLISLANAFTLSLNSFTTLGFGNIPTHGLARYVCIIEGFIGWFLLSLFTVALINQITT